MDGLVIGLLIGVVIWFVHLWRFMLAEERFEKRYDEAAEYWQTENRKLSTENANYRIAWDHMRQARRFFECGQGRSDETAAMRSESNSKETP